MTVNDWPVRCRDRGGKPAWARLDFDLRRGDFMADMTLRAVQAPPAEPAPGVTPAGRPASAPSEPGLTGVRVRLGPFADTGSSWLATVDGRPVEAKPELSGDAAWIWITCDLAADPITIRARAERAR